MDNTIQKALYVTLLALGLAFLFNFLFFSKMIGVSLFLFVAVFVAILYFFGGSQNVNLKNSLPLLVLALLFSFFPTVRANEFLTFLNVVAVFGLLMLFAYQVAGTKVYFMKLKDYFRLAVLVPFRMLRHALTTVSLYGQIGSSARKHDVWVRIVKGIILALPILLLFGLLFSQADLAFAQFLKNFIDIEISERTAQYLFLLGFAFVAALSFLSYIFLSKATAPVPAEEVSTTDSERQSKSLEVSVFLGLIAALFLLFIGFQVTYLFGGQANILETGFTYAEYARRGFFELAAVAFLSLVVLFASEKYAAVEGKASARFTIPALLLILEVGIIMFSAWKRLSLYVDAYGMTDPRFYVGVFIVLLLVLFALLAVKFVKSKPEHFFTGGTLASVLAILLAVNVINPHSYIAQTNLERHGRTGKIDTAYMGSLSADAAAQQLELYNKLTDESKDLLYIRLLDQTERLEKMNADWQSANFSRSRALRLLHRLGE